MTICQHFWQYHESGIFRHLHFHVYSWLWRRLPCLLESQLVDQVLLHLRICELRSSKSSNFLYPFLLLITCFEYNKPHSLSCFAEIGRPIKLFFTFLSNSLATILWCLLFTSWSADASIVFWHKDAMVTMVRIPPPHPYQSAGFPGRHLCLSFDYSTSHLQVCILNQV